MSSIVQKISYAVTLFLVMLFGALTYFVFDLTQKVDHLVAIQETEPVPIVEKLSTAHAEVNDVDSKLLALRSELEETIHSATASLSGVTTPKTTVVEKTTTSDQKDTDHITLGATSSTTSTDWVDIPGTEVYVDLANDYSEDAWVEWSASLKVAHGNGKAYARLYDATNKIAVAGSEISTTNNSSYEQVISGQLALWRGRNLYKVQLKSLNSLDVSVSNARIKIRY